jgi:hypothetical protein
MRRLCFNPQNPQILAGVKSPLKMRTKREDGSRAIITSRMLQFHTDQKLGLRIMDGMYIRGSRLVTLRTKFAVAIFPLAGGEWSPWQRCCNDVGGMWCFECRLNMEPQTQTANAVAVGMLRSGPKAALGRSIQHLEVFAYHSTLYAGRVNTAAQRSHPLLADSRTPTAPGLGLRVASQVGCLAVQEGACSRHALRSHHAPRRLMICRDYRRTDHSIPFWNTRRWASNISVHLTSRFSNERCPLCALDESFGRTFQLEQGQVTTPSKENIFSGARPPVGVPSISIGPMPPNNQPTMRRLLVAPSKARTASQEQLTDHVYCSC